MSKGGKRKGAGRPALPPEEKAVMGCFRLPPKYWAWIKERGGGGKVVKMLIDNEEVK